MNLTTVLDFFNQWGILGVMLFFIAFAIANYITSWKPEVGDYCVLLHLDRSIKSLLSGDTNDKELKSNGNLHDLNDCVAIGPFGPFK